MNSITASRMSFKEKTKRKNNTRLSLSSASDCSVVVTVHLLIYSFLRGLVPTTAAVVAATVQRLQLQNCVNFSRVRHIAQEKGTTYFPRAKASAAVPEPPTRPWGRTTVSGQSTTTKQVLAMEALPEPVMLTLVFENESSLATAQEDVQGTGHGDDEVYIHGLSTSLHL